MDSLEFYHEAQTRILELRAQLHHLQQQYYQEGHSPVTDREYDQLYEELELLEQHVPELRTPDSPTQTVGTMPVGDVVTYPSPLYSLDHTYDREGVERFIQRVGAQQRYYADAKLDGVAVRLLYQKGVLHRAILRGDKRRGRDITRQATVIRSIPITLSAPLSLDVVGEVTAMADAYQTINQMRQAQQHKRYVSPRHAVVGLLTSHQLERAALRLLMFTPYKLHRPPKPLDRHEQVIKALETWGFTVQPGVIFTGTDLHPLVQFVTQVHETQAASSPAADGVVIRLDDLTACRRLGYTARAPRYAIAYKFSPAPQVAQIQDIVYTVGRTGQVSPLAQFTPPVMLSGVTVRRATLHSAQTVQTQGYGPGVQVTLGLAGNAIPTVTGRHGDPVATSLPTQCPACDHPLVHVGKHLHCQYTACSGILHAQLCYAVSRDVLDLPGFGPSVLQTLLQQVPVHTLCDLLRRIETLTPPLVVSLATYYAGQQRLRQLRWAIHQRQADTLRRILLAMSLQHLTPMLCRRVVQQHPAASLQQHFTRLQHPDQLHAMGIVASTAQAITTAVQARQEELQTLVHYLTTPPPPEHLDTMV